MRKLIVGTCSTVTSYIGWAIGAPIGTMTAFMISMVATGLGIYLGIKLSNHLLD